MELDEPVRRYLAHAVRDGARPARGTRLTMCGRINVGVWLPFTATWEGDGRSFAWRARSGPRGVLHVVDQFAGGAGSMDIRALGRLPLLHADDADTIRSAAGRTAAEAMWAPAGLLPEHGVAWRAASDEVIVATWYVPPERPDLHLRIAPTGAVRAIWLERWRKGSGYVPCGGDVLEERRFGEVTIPSRVSVGWWYGTPRYKPFFECEVLAAEPL